MAKLVVEVIDASDLMPKDGQGSANPFVEVDFNQQRHRTQTKAKDLNPAWNEKLMFNISNPNQLPESTIDVVVYNDSRGDLHKSFLGRIRISGASVRSEQEATVERYPLEKRGLFSRIRGDVALRIYAVHDPSYAANMKFNANDTEPPLQGIHGENVMDDDLKAKRKKKKEKEVRTFHSIGTNYAGMPVPPPVSAPASSFPGSGFDMNNKSAEGEKRSDFARVAPTAAMHIQVPGQPEYGLIETHPPLAARMGYRGGYKTASTFDLVEQMHYLYVNVVKARDLPVMDVTGSLDPYVELKLGNYRSVTRHFVKNQHPVWMQIFAFSREHLQANLLEVLVKDKDTLTKDDIAGRVIFDISEVPLRVPPDSPLAPQWYRLEDKHGQKKHGELMLAVWMGTQADESFSEAWLSDAHDVSHEDLSNTRSKVYFSPRLYYLRVHVIEAQDLLLPSDRGGAPEIFVKIQIGTQFRATRPSAVRSFNAVWNDELMFVVPEPMDEYILITVEDKVGPNKYEILGRLILPISVARPRYDHRMVDSRWFNLERHFYSSTEEGEKKKEVKFASKIHLRLCLDAGYHVLDEATHYSSDLQPSARQLQKPTIGILELGILSAKNMHPTKASSGRATDAYCVAKYGNKWIRTRTLLNTLAPTWNEQYTWDVYDPCTVITIGVFDNNHVHVNGHSDSKDQKIGKVRIRLSTLETDRVYTHYYPLLSLHPSGLRKAGELHLALRFTCTAWMNMVTLYAFPLLPKMHYIQPIPVRHIDWLRHQAMQLVAARLARAEPPLRRETVEYMLDVDYHMWSLRRSKANFYRIMSLLSGLVAIGKWFDDICNWRNPMTTCLVHVLFLILICYPELILPTVFLYLCVIGIWNYRFRPRNPPHMDPRLSHAEKVHPDELDEEFDTFPTSRPSDIVRMRYDRLRSVAGRIQTVAGDLATQGERVHALLSWRDPKATGIFIIISLFWAMFLYVTPIQVVAVLAGLYYLRHPRLRSRLPSVPVNFFKRLPAKSDMLI